MADSGAQVNEDEDEDGLARSLNDKSSEKMQ
jgi:hypothetical protein